MNKSGSFPKGGLLLYHCVSGGAGNSSVPLQYPPAPGEQHLPFSPYKTP